MARRQSATRPHTCPILTPQFHWNFNALAVESLSEQELAQVYQLFRFYDSSTIGDALPSVNCRRFLQVLRDGYLVAPPISSSSRASDGQKEHMDMNLLSVSAVEKIFAEAVMGKLRTYLDADGEPALTFHLFCGALMNCAITALPVYKSQPTAALKQLLSRYFSMLDQYAQDCKREPHDPSTLLRHFSSEGLNALWCQDEAHGASIPSILCEPDEHDRTEERCQILEFHKREPFQQVISTFTLDMAHEARAKERSSEQYTIPAELEASFPPAKLRLVIERFQLFDVFDRGTLPRREILPFLTGLVKKLEITDIFRDTNPQQQMLLVPILA
uniref:EF-hand domain-containing protein n=1 Tax=Globisporangium ultimum (strain ATCC 200006 / CBS 805.95 / DAOM BR144) TaxID=431595 RepID=K3X518_GLOUD